MSVDVYNLQNEETSSRSQLPSASDMHSDTKPKTPQPQVSKKIADKDICMLARQLATLLRAGMPLVPALSVLVEQLQATQKSTMRFSGSNENPLAVVMKQVTEDVSAGSSLADAIKKFPNVFSSLFVNMVAAGEMASTLEKVLMQLAQMLEKRVNLTAKVKSAIAYPVMMIIVAVCVVTFILSYVVPGLTEIFLEMNRSLPWPTRMLISISSFMKSYLLPVLPLVYGYVPKKEDSLQIVPN
jgi:type II secretory pathway component PulF